MLVARGVISGDGHGYVAVSNGFGGESSPKAEVDGLTGVDPSRYLGTVVIGGYMMRIITYVATVE